MVILINLNQFQFFNNDWNKQSQNQLHLLAIHENAHPFQNYVRTGIKVLMAKQYLACYLLNDVRENAVASEFMR